MTERERKDLQNGVIRTPTSQYLADIINAEMKRRGWNITNFNNAVGDDVSIPTLRRIRAGASGPSLRSFELVLKAVDMEIVAIPIQIKK